MFSKKNLHLTLAFVLLIGLAAMGIAYGAWSDTLTLNGTVNTGTFDVDLFNGTVWEESEWNNGGLDIAQCEVVPSATESKEVTFKVTNAYPGFTCEGFVTVVNNGTVPAKVHGLQLVNSDVPASYLTVVLKSDTGTDVPAGGSFILHPDTLTPGANKYGQIGFTFTMPADGSMNQNLTFKYTILAEQAQ